MAMHTTSIATMITTRLWYEAPRKRAVAKAVQRIQKPTTTVRTRRIVINALYLKCSFMARSLSTEIADMTKNETPAQIHDSEPVVMIFAMQNAGVFLWISKTICRVKVGWTTRPTSKSANARQQRRVLDGVRSVGVLDTARRINVLPIVAVRAVSEFSTIKIRYVRKISLAAIHSSSKWKQFILVISGSTDGSLVLLVFSMTNFWCVGIGFYRGLRELYLAAPCRKK